MGPISFLMRTSSFEKTLVWTPYATESVLEGGLLVAASARPLAVGAERHRDTPQAVTKPLNLIAFLSSPILVNPFFASPVWFLAIISHRHTQE
jgi:hypothetical protein